VRFAKAAKRPRPAPARAIGAAVAACCCLVCGSAHAFAYNAIDVNDQLIHVGGQLDPIVWNKQNVSFTINLGDPALRQDTLTAMEEWNSVGANIALASGNTSGGVCSESDGANVVKLTTSNCGRDFGDILGLTRFQSIAVGDTYYMIDADIQIRDLNAEGDAWSARSGTSDVEFSDQQLCVSAAGGSKVCDFYRVVIHELGHAIGLTHPDEVGQRKAAVMNSGISGLSKPFHLTADDMAGARFLYPPTRGAAADATAAPPRATSKGGGGAFTLLSLLLAGAWVTRRTTQAGRRAR
jgi:hypothetical protein